MSSEQSAFIHRCNIHNNILITQEATHIMYSSKGKNYLVHVKLDLDNSFDRLSWTSILQVISNMNFLPKFIHWIQSCISSLCLSYQAQLSSLFKDNCFHNLLFNITIINK